MSAMIALFGRGLAKYEARASGGRPAHTRAPRTVMAFALAASALLAPRAVWAFCRTTTTKVPASFSPTEGCFTEGLPLFWKGACVGYDVNQNASALVPLQDATRVIDAAFTTWNTATCSASGATVGINASNLGPVACSEVGYNQNGPNQNVIIFRDDQWPYNDPNNTLGLTTVTFNTDTGEIYDADMEINSSGKNLTTTTVVPADGFDLLSVITHEAGHFLGLAHATDSRSTMFASYQPGTSGLRTLKPDDIAGICTIYPTTTERSVAPSVAAGGITAATACDATPRHGFSSACDSNASPSAPGSSGHSGSSSSSGGCAVGPAGPATPGGSAWGAGGMTASAAALLILLRRGRRERIAR
jgi:hypothetical protein